MKRLLVGFFFCGSLAVFLRLLYRNVSARTGDDDASLEKGTSETVTDIASADSQYAALDPFAQRQMSRLAIPGGALVVGDGEAIVHVRGFGEARPGGDAPCPQTPFLIGSLIKSFTGMAVMQLVEAR
jgi:CubicO group peptidase (beta-lactamase class C family)